MATEQNGYWAPTSPPYAQQISQQQQLQQQQHQGLSRQSHPHHRAQYQAQHPQQQQHFLPPTSHPSQVHQQYQQHQPQLQLEHHYDQLAGLEGLTGHLPMSPPQSLPQQSMSSGSIPPALPQLPPPGLNGGRNIAGPSAPPILGVGQGPGNASPKYTAATATALSATDPSQFVFAAARGGSPSGSPSHHGRGSPSASGSPNAHGTDPFNASFTFASAQAGLPPHQPGVVTGAPLVEGIAPHSGLHQSRPQPQPMQQQQDYLHPSGYSPQHTVGVNKRRRADTAAETGSQGHDPDSDYEQYQGQSSGSIEGYTMDPNYEPYGDAYEYEGQYQDGPGYEGGAAYHQQMGQPGMIPGMLPGMSGIPMQDAQGAPIGQPTQEQKPKGQGACVRCKNLKVRCEFTTDPNTCRRCLNGNHDCMIPGRKKRRQPPKREHLLNQIRDQASQIQKLMEQLEEANRRQRLHHGEPPRLSLSNTPLPPPGGTTPVPGNMSDVTTPGASSSASGNVSASGSYTQPKPRQDVQDWISRARESIQTIGGLLDNSAFAEEEWDAEENEQDGWDEVDNAYFSSGGEGPAGSGSEYADAEDQGEDEITVEVPDEFEGVETGTVRHASPSSTLGGLAREGSANPSQHSSASGRRKTPQPPRLAPLPATSAAPFGLIAQMTLATKGAKERERAGSRSPRSSRAGSVEVQGQDHPSPAGTASDHGATSPRSVSGDQEGANVQNGEVQVVVKLEDETAYGATAPGFFEARRGSVPDPSRLAPSRHPIPHILMRGIVAPSEVEELFKIYFEKMNLSCSLLDPVLYTAQKTYWRSPFLFTVICAISSRYYPGRPGLYEELITYAQLAAGTALISGPKTVETVSAYILLSLYPVPMRRWEEDRTWLYLGLAIRVATDLNLHVPTSVRPRNETHARELLNRTRVWLNCYNLDRSTSSWHGKQSTIADSDYLATHSAEWWKSSQYNFRNFDIHLAGYNVELRVMNEFKKKIYSSASSPTGLDKSLEINKLAAETDEKLVQMEAEWNERLGQNTDSGDEQARFRNSLLKLAYRYSRLIVLSFGFQHSFVGKAHSDQTIFFNRCYNAASDVLRVFIDELSTQKVYLKHGPEAQCIFITFASSFLIKLLHPKYATYLQLAQREEIQSLVRAIIDLLSDPEVVVDERHSPKLWARFLDGLLATPMAKVQLSPSALKGASNLPSKARRRTTQRGGSAGASEKKRGSASPASSHASPGSQRGLSPETMQSSPSSDAASLSAQAQLLPSVSEEQTTPGTVSQASVPHYSYDHGDQMYQMQAGAQMPQQHQSHDMQGGVGGQNALQMNVGEVFQTLPLFDNDLFQTMQSMPDTSIWQDMNMPGFNWMGVLQAPEADTIMQDPSTNYNLNQPIVSGNQY